MYRTMLDLIKPKLVYLDLPLFMALLSDLFPGVEQPPTPAGALKMAIEADLVENNLQVLLPSTALFGTFVSSYDCRLQHPHLQCNLLMPHASCQALVL